MLVATSRWRNLGVGVAGVLDFNLLSLGALDLSGIVGSVSRERGQTNVPTVLLRRKRRNNVRRKMIKEQKSTRYKLRVPTAGAWFSVVKGGIPSSSHTGTTDEYVGMIAFKPSKLRFSG